MNQANLDALRRWLESAESQLAVHVLTKLARDLQIPYPADNEQKPELWLQKHAETLLKQAEIALQSSKTNAPNFKDLRTIPCPLNSAKARVFMHKLPAGTEAEIWLDPGKPIENVPSSLIADGHRILSRTKDTEQNFWKLHILRRNED